MATQLDIAAQDYPLSASMTKSYNVEELENLIAYVNQSVAWFEGLGIDQSVEDAVAIRVGVPYLGSDKTVDANDVYVSDDNIDRLIASLGLDFLKISVNTGDTTRLANNQMDSYTYKSSHIHRIFGNVFVDGVENKTDIALLDSADVLSTRLAMFPVEYGGVAQVGQTIPQEIPEYVIACLQYITQNPLLVMRHFKEDLEYFPGDLTYFTTKEFVEMIKSAKFIAEGKFPVVSEVDLPLSKEAAIRYILEDIGMDTAFDSLNMGGLLEELTLEMAIPASRSNQDMLEGVLTMKDGVEGATFPEIFRGVFVEEWRTMSPDELEGSEKVAELNDVYSTEVTDEFIVGGKSVLDDVSEGHYGCKRETQVPIEDSSGRDPSDTEWDPTYTTTLEFRYWLVADEWLHSASAERLAIVFWAALDLRTNMENSPCPYDTIIIVIVIIVVTYFTAGIGTTLASGASLSTAQYLAIAAAMVSIGTTIGAIDQKTGMILGAVLAVASLGTSLIVNGIPALGSTAGVALVTQVSSTALTVVNTLDKLPFLDDMEELDEETQQQQSNTPEFYESEVRYMLGGYQDRHISEGCGFDYEKNYHDMYDRYSVFTGNGFRNS